METDKPRRQPLLLRRPSRHPEPAKSNGTASPPTDPDTAPTPTVAAGPAGSDERGPAEMAAAASAAPVATASAPATADPDARMTPAVRRLLREHDLSPAQIPGTGGGGRITREDVLKVVEAIRTGTAVPAAPAAPPRAPRRPRPVRAGARGFARRDTVAGDDRLPRRRR